MNFYNELTQKQQHGYANSFAAATFQMALSMRVHCRHSSN